MTVDIETFALTSDRDHLRWLADAGVNEWGKKAVLDLGCGSGYVCAHVKALGADYAAGIDIVRPKLVDVCHTWDYRSLDLEARDWHSSLNRSFDIILAFDIIEHLSSPYFFLESCKSLLRKNGALIVTTPNIFSWERLANPTGWSGAQDPQHKILFSRYSLTFLLHKAGFKNVTTRAPMRKLAFFGPLQPQIGGQIFCRAEV